MKPIFFTLLLILLGISSTQAADIASDIRRGPAGIDNSDGGYLELGLGVEFYLIGGEGAFEDPFPTLAGAYRYRGFFFEAVHESDDGATIGYNAWNNDRWSFDLIGASLSGGILISIGSDEDTEPVTQQDLDDEIRFREDFYNGAGARLTGYFGNAVFQYKLVTDTHDNNGVRSTARLGYSWQVRNWNFHSIASTQYTSGKTSRYLYGITASEATENFPAYSLGSTLNYSFEIGATYPLSEDLVFRSTAKYILFDEDIVKSSLQEDEELATVLFSLSYVF